VITFQDIEAARARIKGAVYLSPCSHSIPLSDLTGLEIFCKLENLQRTGSFKERGARNALAQLSTDQQKRGVIAASAGNHAQALAYQGKLLGIPATVVMPQFAPLIKISNCQKLGADVVLHGKDFGEAKTRAHEIAQEKGLAYIDGYDDPAIIAGQGTTGIEIVEQVPDVDLVVVPVGGAGLLAGVALAVKTLRPQTKIVAVEADYVASFSAALEAGKPTRTAMHPTLADGLAIPQVGANGFEVARSLVDRTVTVTEEQIAIAILRLVEMEKSVVEGAGATPLAACLSGKLKEFAGKRVVLKDNICLAGVPMMNGASTLEGYVPDVDATVATRILDAGGTIAGKAHCEYFCLSGGSHTSASGPVHNPYKLGYSAGGSSRFSATCSSTSRAFAVLR